MLLMTSRHTATRSKKILNVLCQQLKSNRYTHRQQIFPKVCCVNIGSGTARRTKSSASSFPPLQSDSVKFTADSEQNSSSVRLAEKSLCFKNVDGKLLEFHYVWLRDHCKCPKCYHPVTNQRLIDTFMIPLDIKPANVSLENEVLNITWSDGHISNYDTSWLSQHQYGQLYQWNDVREIGKVLWDGSAASSLPVDVVFSEILEDEQKLLEYLETLVKYGIAFVNDVPQPYSENLRLVAEQMGLVLKTFYGDVYTFSNENIEYADTAYTAERIECHTDGTYFFESPGYQLLHCNMHKGSGGENFFVDGFHIANELKKSHPESYDFLANTKIPAYYFDKNKYSFKTFDRMIKLDDHTNEIYHIRFNSYDRDVLSCLSFEDVERFYEASHQLTKLIRDPSNEFQVKPCPGRAVFFDNWRVFHARTEFTGIRSMTGLYVGKADFLSRVRSLRLKLSK